MTSFTIASLNIRHGQGMPRNIRNAYTSFSHPKEKMEENAKHIARRFLALEELPDIICLQESNTMAKSWPDVAGIIRERLRYPYLATSSKRLLPHNNAIISRIPFRSVASKQFRKHRLVQSGNPASLMASLNRGFIAVELEDIGTIINTHLDPFDARVRHMQTKELLTHIDHTRPTILAGDLNPASFDERGLSMIAERGLRTSPALEARHFNKHATWPHTRQKIRTPFMRLDYIFTTPHFAISSIKIFDTRLSDHAGLVASIVPA